MGATDLREELPEIVTDALERGLTVVTANQRAARTLRRAFDKRNRDAGLQSWSSAAILPWEGWVADLWNHLLLRGGASDALLNRAQEHALWREIIAADSDLPTSLRSADSLAEMAAEAWRLLAQHNGLDRLRQNWSTPETKTFRRWAQEFERQCRMQHLLPRAALESALHRAIVEDRLHTQPIALFGFDEMLPSQKLLTSSIASKGGAVETLSVATQPERRLLTAAEEEQAEIKAAARWIRERLKENPARRIAVISASLEERRHTIDHTFREILAPELQDIRATSYMPMYEFSLGIPLSETPMVRTALELLRWCISPLPVDRVSALLLSPLFAMKQEEHSSRAAFDAFELRKAKLLHPEISLAWLSDALRRSRRRSQLVFINEIISNMTRSASALADERRSHTAWADFIRTWLETAQWGRRTGEDSVEFQARRKWESTLDELATLDFNGRQVNLAAALKELERLVQQTMFAPESQHAPVQIMGPLEAAGSTFDALWFLGAGDLGWPVKSAASPLLPWPLQRELGVPGADPNNEDARARQITERIAASASQVIFSYPSEVSEGVQRPSPLLRSLQLEPIDIATVSPPDPMPTPIALEEFSDQLPLPPPPDDVVRGGAEILKLQAACGFRAFAERRLGSAHLREIELGMDAGERGSVLHRVLEHFWKQVRSQSALKAMSTEERSAALASSIEHGLQRAAAAARTSWERAYLDLQRSRLMALLDLWLDLELGRRPFTVKVSEEEMRDAQIGPLRLDLRVDRIDVTEEGEIIIDYKTGGAKSAHWQTERPDEPQLPLYAVLSQAAHPDTPLADLAFAQVRAGKDMAFESFTQKITAKKSAARKRDISLEEQLTEWQRILEDLATAFYSGQSEVDPKNYPSTCAHCEQRIFCRLNPNAFDEDLDEETPIDFGNR